MSYDTEAWAVKQKTGRGTTKAILMYLASRADQAHTCFPKVPTIAADTEYDESTVRRAITALVEVGLVRQFYRYHRDGARRSCRYLLMVDGPDTKMPERDWIHERHCNPDCEQDCLPGTVPANAGAAPGGYRAQRPVTPSTNPQYEPPVDKPSADLASLDRAAVSEPPVPVVETAQTILAAWLDFSGNPPIGSVVARWGREIKRMLAWYPVQKIKNVLARVTKERNFSKPYLLEKYLIETDCGSATTVRNSRQRQNDEWLAMIRNTQAAEAAVVPAQRRPLGDPREIGGGIRPPMGPQLTRPGPPPQGAICAAQ